jgi:hypothetical protein
VLKVSRIIVHARDSPQTIRNARLRSRGTSSARTLLGRDSDPEKRFKGLVLASGKPDSVRDSRSNARFATNRIPATPAA